MTAFFGDLGFGGTKRRKVLRKVGEAAEKASNGFGAAAM